MRSTNIVAVPPSGDDASAVVAVPYDTPRGAGDGGEALGLFLELARALRVVEEAHSVEFVALGAEHADVSGGHLGTRRLAQSLREEDQDPLVVLVGEVARGAPFRAAGPGADLLRPYAPPRSSSKRARPVPPDPESMAAVRILTAAGFDAVAVTGDATDLGRTLLAFLAQRD